MTLWDLYTEGEAELLTAGLEDAQLDARLLLQEAFSLTADRYLAVRNEELSVDDITKNAVSLYRSFIERRAERIPLQLITGSTQFMGLTFSVKKNVLIPRQDTETLVEQVLVDCGSDKAASDHAGAGPDHAAEGPVKTPDGEASLLDLCTGSGCIAVSLAVKGNFSRIAATDISADALNAARENAARYNLKDIEFYQGDLFSALPYETPPFSVITVNPPYIPTGDIDSLQPEVKYYDPPVALDGSSDGLAFYRRIAAGVGPHLTENGQVYMEIGYDQAKAVCDIFKDSHFTTLKVVQDLSGKDRVVVAGGLKV